MTDIKNFTLNFTSPTKTMKTVEKIPAKGSEGSYSEIQFVMEDKSKNIKVSASDLPKLDVAWLNEQYAQWYNTLGEDMVDPASVLLTSNQKHNVLVEYLVTKSKTKLSQLPAKMTLRQWKPTENQRETVQINKSFDYEDVQLIGRGGFSEVFIARKKNSGQFVAVKRVEKGRLGGAKTEKDLILQERETMLKLHGPFLANLIGAFQTSRHFYFTMEYIACGNLRQLISESRPLTEEEIRHFISEIIAAMEFIHQAGYILRDLKSDNILLDENGHIYLCDMGLTGRGPKDGELLHAYCGTIEYMAPEAVARKGYTYSADYYSLGIIAYELAEGLPPFFRQNREDNITAQVLNEVPVMRSKRSAEFQDFVASLLSKDPNTRLGAVSGLNEIMSHSWLNSVDFQKIRRRKNSTPASILPLLKYVRKTPSGSPNKKPIKKPNKSVIELPGFTLETVESEGEIEALNEDICDDMNVKLLQTLTLSTKHSLKSSPSSSKRNSRNLRSMKNSLQSASVEEESVNECDVSQDLEPEVNGCCYKVPKKNVVLKM